jgi:hypothetical protein
MKEASLLFCLPDNPFFLANEGPEVGHAVQEATYACTPLILCSCGLKVPDAIDAGQTRDGSSRNISATDSEPLIIS